MHYLKIKWHQQIRQLEFFSELISHLRETFEDILSFDANVI